MLKAANMYTKQNAWKVKAENRFLFHVTGQVGWINDPNGFAFFQNKIHLFYQHNPYQTVWGPMHWGHAVSQDFIKWEYLDIALAPDKNYDAVGAFSGSAIEFGGKYYLVYTGASDGVQVQAIAVSTDGVHYTKYESNPVIDSTMLPANSSVADFRDPKVWEKDGTVYMIVSSRNATNQYSKLLLYKTTNMIDWTYAGKLLGNGSNMQNKLGIMFECPDYFELGGRGVITVSPQTVFGHQNADSNVYIVGDLNYQTGTFENWNFDEIAQIDYGFDFYAPQSMLMPDGRRILVAWMASWNRRPIYFGTGIAGAITLPREIWLVGNKLYQLPVSELANYYQNAIHKVYSLDTPTYQYNPELSGWYQDITLEFDPLAGKTGISVFDDGQGNGMKIYYENGRVYVDRYGVTEGYYAATDFHNITSVDALLVNGKVKIRIVLDRYSAEIFVSDGYKAMTVTGFPNANQIQTALFSTQATMISVTKYDIILE
jgi:beta-fructofuranosidase